MCFTGGPTQLYYLGHDTGTYDPSDGAVRNYGDPSLFGHFSSIFLKLTCPKIKKNIPRSIHSRCALMRVFRLQSWICRSHLGFVCKIFLSVRFSTSVQEVPEGCILLDLQMHHFSCFSDYKFWMILNNQYWPLTNLVNIM